MSVATPTTIRLTAEERELAEKLGNYLHKVGRLDTPSISNVLRLALHFMTNEILKGIEAERYAEG
jgi:hypothetical protein